MYGGGSPQYPLYGTGSTGGLLSSAAAYYPYLNLSSEGTGGAAAYSASQGYAGGLQYPHHLFQYSAINSTAIYPPHYGTPVSLAPPTPLQSGLCLYYNTPSLFLNYVYPVLQSLQHVLPRGTNIFDSLLCRAAGVTMTLHAPIPIPHR